MSQSFDLTVIGSGPGGYVAAARAASLGLKVALVEKDSALGGTCLHRGCIPTKALLHAADVYDEVKHGASMGIKTSGVKIDWPEVQKYKNKIINTNALGVAHLMKTNKITVFEGFGKILDKNTVEITQKKDSQKITTKNILLAVGSTPRLLPGTKTDSSRILTSDTILGLKKVPASLVIIGGGVIGVEFASIFARFHTKVTIVEYMPRILATADEDCSKVLESELKKQGVNFFKDARVEKITAKSSKAQVSFTQNDANLEVEGEYVLVCVGRSPLTKDIGLENTNATLDDKGFIEVSPYLQTKEPNIYAIGDCVNTPWLAHIASKEGLIAVDHLAQKDAHPINYLHTPSCVYSEPQVAWSGYTEKEAKEQGYDVNVSKFDFARSGKASILQKTKGFIKFISDKKYGEILGVHIVGPQATELLAEPAFAMQMEACIDDIANTIHSHPTLYESIYEAALKNVGAAIHG